jgi:rubrerythrin
MPLDRPTTRSGFKRISDIRNTGPADVTLQNLVTLLHTKIEISARLPILAYEADAEGHTACADVFRSVAMTEEAQIIELFGALKQRLDVTLDMTEAGA